MPDACEITLGAFSRKEPPLAALHTPRGDEAPSNIFFNPRKTYRECSYSLHLRHKFRSHLPRPSGHSLWGVLKLCMERPFTPYSGNCQVPPFHCQPDFQRLQRSQTFPPIPPPTFCLPSKSESLLLNLAAGKRQLPRTRGLTAGGAALRFCRKMFGVLTCGESHVFHKQHHFDKG